MKFVMIKEYSWDLSKDKVIIGEITEKYTVNYTDGSTEERVSKRKITIAYLLKMGDFAEENEYNILLNTESIQIRPKAIYRNDKGFYIKNDGKRKFLNKEETEEVENAVERFKKYLEGVKSND